MIEPEIATVTICLFAYAMALLACGPALYMLWSGDREWR